MSRHQFENPGKFKDFLAFLCKRYEVKLNEGAPSTRLFYYEVLPDDKNYSEREDKVSDLKKYEAANHPQLAQKYQEYLEEGKSEKEFNFSTTRFIYSAKFTNKIQGEGVVGVQTNLKTNKQRKMRVKLEESKAEKGVTIEGNKRNIGQVVVKWDKSFDFKIMAPL